jgi:thioesterase domain-containing protein
VQHIPFNKKKEQETKENGWHGQGRHESNLRLGGTHFTMELEPQRNG